MGRKENRNKRKLEVNPVVELSKIIQKFYPELNRDFSSVKDSRNQSYITYPVELMLNSVFYKNAAGIETMQQYNEKGLSETFVKNVWRLSNVEETEFLPHYLTLNEFAEKFDINEIEEIRRKIFRKFVRRKTFDDAKFRKNRNIIIDATRLYSSFQKHNSAYLSQTFNRGTEQEKTVYYRSVVEAKVYLGNDIVMSLESEFEDNSDIGINSKSEGDIKQDCEIKAFKRLAEKIKKNFPRLPVCLLMDSLYAAESVIEICESNSWDYIIRFKDGSIPNIAKEFNDLLEINRKEGYKHPENIDFVNAIDYNGHKVNELRLTQDNNGTVTEFQWLTNIEITENNAKKITEIGRKRWKIENQGFNRQKHWQGEIISHACSHNDNAQKFHYLMEQLADLFKMLYEYFFLKKNEIEKKQKNISSDLLQSLTGELIKTEDIFEQSIAKLC